MDQGLVDHQADATRRDGYLSITPLKEGGRQCPDIGDRALALLARRGTAIFGCCISALLKAVPDVLGSLFGLAAVFRLAQPVGDECSERAFHDGPSVGVGMFPFLQYMRPETAGFNIKPEPRLKSPPNASR